MKEDNYFWKYTYEPGKKTNNIIIYQKPIKPLVSIITSYYNSFEFMEQTIQCVLNQTFPFWEWIIVDDGSDKKEAIEYLKKVERLDERIKVYRKQNEGLAKGRDYAIKYSNTDYILPLDADDLIEPTYIETLYFSLKTNKEASWAFTNSVGFGKYRYLTDSIFDSEKMKVDNQITATALIKKDDILKLGGYGQAARYINEDWHLWLRMLADNKFPVQVGYYGFWYRRKDRSLLTEINDERKREYELKMQELKVQADKITQKINAIVYPKNQNTEIIKSAIDIPEILFDCTTNKSELYILPFLGTDKKMYNTIKNASKKNNIIVVIMQQSENSAYYYRQKYEEFSTVYDLTTFLDSKYWIDFINYLIKNKNIKRIYISNTIYKEQLGKEFEFIELKKCSNNNIQYKLGVLKYKFMNCIFIRFFRRTGRIIKKHK